MAELWYRTKDWIAYINNAHILAENESEDSEIHETLANLRVAARDYHNCSVAFTKREIKSSDLQTIQDDFTLLKNKVDEWLNQR
jgi:hypothetical protein